MAKNRSARHYTDNYYQGVAGMARAAVAALSISRFKGHRNAGGHRRFTVDDSASARRVLGALEKVPVALLDACSVSPHAVPSKPLPEGLPEALGEGFRTEARTGAATVGSIFPVNF